jgi:CBS domain-containing protein
MAKAKRPGMRFPSILDRAYSEYKRHRKVSDIMTTGVVVTTPERTMEDAARIMGERHIGSLFVVKYGSPIGIVTERDLISRVLADRLDPGDTTVEQVMSFPLVRICPDLEIREAARTMIKRKGRLAVFSCGHLEGIVTASDLIREMPDAPETTLSVDDYMTRDLVSVESDTPVSEVVDTMGKKRIGSVIVSREDKPHAIFTERDLLSGLLAKGSSLETGVGEVSSSPLITAPSGISIHEAAQMMATKHVRRLPIVRKNDLAGIITARDLVEAYAQ